MSRWVTVCSGGSERRYMPFLEDEKERKELQRYIFNELDLKDVLCGNYAGVRRDLCSRSQAVCGGEGVEYTYNCLKRTATTWSGPLKALAQRVSDVVGTNFNLALVESYYGSPFSSYILPEGRPPIAMMYLGSTSIAFECRSDIVSFKLAPGGLLVITKCSENDKFSSVPDVYTTTLEMCYPSGLPAMSLIFMAVEPPEVKPLTRMKNLELCEKIPRRKRSRKLLTCV